MSGARRQRPEPVPGQGAAGWQGPRASVVGVPRKLCRLGGAGEISESGVVTEEFFRKSSWREGPVGVPSVGSAVAARQWVRSTDGASQRLKHQRQVTTPSSWDAALGPQ